ncbi:MAG: undecaprenyl-diphosphate phosphatase [Deferribacterota bacterium]|nr:undecaprenyl-diphosphate phosphatase [Deferribacterota bacterium]
MELLDGLILGIIQGFTEFLPISSSAHLVITEKLLNIDYEGIILEVLLHVATLLSVLIYFRKRLFNIFKGLLVVFNDKYRVYYYENKRFIYSIIIGTIPTAFIGFYLNQYINMLFNNIELVGYCLIITSIFLIISDFFKTNGELTLVKSFIIGIAQGFAVFPGISRSGITISSGLMMNIRRETVAEFSFLLSIPSIIGALILKIDEIQGLQLIEYKIYLFAFISSFLSGLFAIYIVLKVVKLAKFRIFALYCLLLGIYSILWL